MLLSCAASAPVATAQNALIENNRMMWGSITKSGENLTNVNELKAHRGKLLLTWRMLPGEGASTAFDVYKVKSDGRVKMNDSAITGKSNFQVPAEYLVEGVDNTFEVSFAGESAVLDTYTMPAEQLKERRPYFSIYLKDTADDQNINDVPEYISNDATVGDLDGDGEYEIVLARFAHGYDENYMPRSRVIMEAYKLDGTWMWRVVCGNNVAASNAVAMIVADVDGDGKEEVAIRSSEGTVFGDGERIGDTNGDGITDYAGDGKYNSRAPEFISVIDGSTGAEKARAPYIPINTTHEWGDNYFKRANSLRLCAAKLLPGGNFQIVAGRGVYAKMELEAWEYVPGNKDMKHVWKFSTNDYPSYLGQGNHQLSVADVDGDGYDEITYGACAIDHDGTGLYSTRLGHGDMLHVGKFIQDRPGLQCFQCFESGVTRCALRDAATGEILWKLDAAEPGDEGRALIADIDKYNPGYECWVYDRQLYDTSGNIIEGQTAASTNFPIWFTGSLNRQLIDGDRIDCFDRDMTNRRVFTIYRYPITTINDTKKNPLFYGDILGDWREEIIMPHSHATDKAGKFACSDSKEIMIFSTWYPSDYGFPYLASDDVYFKGMKHEQMGYNTPLHMGTYFGSDMPLASVGDIVAEQSGCTLNVADGNLVFSQEPAFVRLVGFDGRTVLSIDRPGVAKISISDIAPGFYIVSYGCPVTGTVKSLKCAIR